MDKIFIISLFIISALFGSKAQAQEKTLRVLAWPGYFSTEFIRAFEKAHNAKVEMTHFYSDEMRDGILYDKRYLHSFDLVLVSAAVAKDYVMEGLLLPLDQTVVTHLGDLVAPVKSSNTSRKYVAMLSYSLLGIAYDGTTTPEPKSWDALFTQTGNVAERINLPDDVSDSMDSALMSLGTSIRGFSDAELMTAANKVHQLVVSNALSDDDQGLVEFFQNGGLYSVMHSSDAVRLMAYDDNIRFVYPNNLTRIWRDYIGIHASSQSPRLANEFINYAISPEGAVMLAKSHFNAVTHPKAVAQLKQEQHESVTSGFVYPHKDVWINVTYHNNPWMDVKKSFLYERIRNATPKT